MSTSTETQATTEAPPTTTTPEEVKVEVKKIKSIILNSTGSGSDYSNLKYVEEDYPKLEKESDFCIIRVKACGLNFAELMQRQGLYKPANKTPYTPGYEGAGVIEECGDKCTQFKVNDRVMYFNGSGAWKDVVCLSSNNMVKIPDSMTFEEAAGIFVNYLTAYQVLYRCGNLREGDSVLIHMAAGGVGTAAAQLCKMVPNVTVYGTASAGKHEYIKKCGVDYPIDYTSTDYIEEIKKICPEGVDIVLDPLNGENAIKGYDLLKPFGRIIHYGKTFSSLF
jgi:synaptic vesicle membrane protein VAT-1